MVLNGKRKPRILLIADIPQWAFHTLANAIREHSSDRYDFDILFGSELAGFDDAQYDLIHVLFETETRHLPFLRGNARVLKSVYSHYWQEEGLSPMDFYSAHLREAHAVSVPNALLLSALQDLPVPVFLCPEGLDTSFFTPPHHPRSGPVVAGWAGNPDRPIKRIELLKEACDGVCELRLTDGRHSPQDMVDFYRTIDVIACSSKAEGSPRPLMEGMACGCFPVSFDVGIAAQLIDHGRNGLLVRDESVAGMRAAIAWCVTHADTIRTLGPVNAEIIRATRDWRSTSPAQARVYDFLLSQRE